MVYSIVRGYLVIQSTDYKKLLEIMPGDKIVNKGKYYQAMIKSRELFFDYYTMNSKLYHNMPFNFIQYDINFVNHHCQNLYSIVNQYELTQGILFKDVMKERVERLFKKVDFKKIPKKFFKSIFFGSYVENMYKGYVASRNYNNGYNSIARSKKYDRAIIAAYEKGFLNKFLNYNINKVIGILEVD